jgi:hypothetical protein
MSRFAWSGLAVALAGGLIVVMQATGQQPVQQYQNLQRGYVTGYIAGRQLPNPYANDPEMQKLIGEEQEFAVRSRELAGRLANANLTADVRKDVEANLRGALQQIFDLQQKRRTTEITKIEERLNKLKETMKKREEAKESIISRRFEVLTGGVDELGWEETGGADNYGAYRQIFGGGDGGRYEEKKPSPPSDSVLERE